MAKYERNFTGDFDALLRVVEEAALASASASYEDGSDWQNGQSRVALRVYERYSMLGSNRVSLSAMLCGEGNSLFLSLVTSGGSEAVLFKINRFGEDNYLYKVAQAVENFAR